MAYAFEQDELRQELRLGTAGVVHHWPKIPGVGNVAVTSATFEVFDPNGESLETGTCTETAVGTVERLDCAVSAISTLDEDYRVQVTFVYSGTTYVEQEYFDVVRWPYSKRTISLNDLQEERVDIEQTLTNLGDRLGKTAEEMATIFGYRAKVELDAMIRDQITLDRRDHAKDFESAGTAERCYSRPNLILNRERLNRVERKLALKLVYAADSINPEEGDDESGALYRFYADQANMAWRGVGPLKYDLGENLQTNKTIHQPSRSIHTRRVQG